MKKHFLFLFLGLSFTLNAQNIEFSKKTKKLYDKIVAEGIQQGLSKDDAIRKAFAHSEYRKLQQEDLAESNKKASKSGIIFSKNFQEIVFHKKVAIIPFLTDIVDNKSKVQSKKQRIKDEKSLSEQIQESLYKYVMKNQFDYNVEFQDVSKTNQILRSTGLINTLSSVSTEELAKALNVDAIIGGEYYQETNKGSVMTSVTTLGLTGGAKATGKIKLKITDGKDDEVLWRIDMDDKNSASNSEDIVNSIMKKISKYFPYSVSFSRE